MLRKFVTLLSGVSVSQLILFISSPFLSRLYTADDFGKYSFGMSLVTIFVAVSSLRFDFLMFGRGKSEARYLFQMALVSIFFFYAFFSVVLFEYFSFGIEPDSRWLIGFLVLAAALFNLVTQCFVRQGFNGNFATYKLIQVLIQVLLALVLGFYGIGDGLIYALCVALLLVSAYGFLFSRPIRIFLKDWSYLRCRSLFDKNKRLAFVSTLAQGMTMGTPLIPIWFIGLNYSVADAGLYFFCVQLVAPPCSMVRRALVNTLASEIHNRDVFRLGLEKFRHFFKYAFLLMIVSSCCLHFLGESIFSFVFGEPWRRSGEYLGVLVFLFALDTILLPMVALLPLLGGHKKQLIFEFFRFVCVLVLCISTFNLGLDVYLYVVLYAVIMCSFTALLFGVSLKAIRLRLRGVRCSK